MTKESSISSDPTTPLILGSLLPLRFLVTLRFDCPVIVVIVLI